MAESRVDLLKWVNSVTQLNYTKIEQCGNGAAYCIIMDSIFGNVPLNKVKLETKNEIEAINNFKILQAIFTKHKIDKAIPVDRLVKQKMQDNLEFIQWLKKYWQLNSDENENYDAKTKIKTTPTTNGPSTSTPTKPTVRLTNRMSMGPRVGIKSPVKEPLSSAQSKASNRMSMGPRFGPIKESAPAHARTRSTIPSSQSSHNANSGNNSNDVDLVSLQREISALSERVLELNLMNRDLINEREFYFSRLTEIERFIQEHVTHNPQEANDFVIKEIQNILFHNASFDMTNDRSFAGYNEPFHDDGLNEDVLLDEDYEDDELDGIY